MEYFIDNLVTSAIRCAERKNVCITLYIQKDEDGLDWYWMRRESGVSTFLCKTTSIRNLLYHIHQMVYSRWKKMPWATTDDFMNPDKP